MRLCTTAESVIARSPYPDESEDLALPKAGGLVFDLTRYAFTAETECIEVAASNREHARKNPRASYADVHDPTPLFDPLTREQAAESADGCVHVTCDIADSSTAADD